MRLGVRGLVIGTGLTAASLGLLAAVACKSNSIDSNNTTNNNTQNIPGVLVVTPPTADFGKIGDSSASADVAFTVKNTGTVTTSSISIAIGGVNLSEFVVDGANPCTSAILAPNATCMFSVKFAPGASAMGTRSATLTATAGSLIGVATLSGTGAVPNPMLALAPVAPGGNNFGSVAVGVASAPQTFTLTNTGDVASGVPQKPAFTGTNAADFAIQSNTCTASLPPSAKCTLAVVFTPSTTTMSESANLTVTTPLAGMATAALSGTGATCASQGSDCLNGASQCGVPASAQSCVCGKWVTEATCAADAGATGYVCERAAPSCVDPNWAEWPMPNGPVDAPPAPNLASYTDNNDGTVTDKITGLMWQQSVDSVSYLPGDAATAGTAANYCATIGLAGHTDWRQPSLMELGSIVDPSVHPALNSTYFPGVISGIEFLTATPVAASPGTYWSLNFEYGFADDFAEQSGYVRCVR